MVQELDLKIKPLDVPSAIYQRRSIKTFKPDNPDIAIAVLVPVGYAAEPRRDPGRLPLSYNVFVDRVGNPYNG